MIKHLVSTLSYRLLIFTQAGLAVLSLQLLRVSFVVCRHAGTVQGDQLAALVMTRVLAVCEDKNRGTHTV